MRRDVFAEWTLARFMQRDRAAAVVGDLQEAALVKGAAWFWKSFLGVLLASAWRPVGGYLAAAFGAGLLFYLFFPAREALRASWLQAWIVPLLSITSFAAFYFGFRDILTRIAAGYTVLCVLALCFWWQAAIPHVLLFVVASSMIAALFMAGARRGIAAFGLLVILQIALQFVIKAPILFCFQHHHLPYHLFMPLLVVSHFVYIWLLCLCCVWIHRHMLEPRGTVAEKMVIL